MQIHRRLEVLPPESEVMPRSSRNAYTSALSGLLSNTVTLGGLQPLQLRQVHKIVWPGVSFLCSNTTPLGHLFGAAASDAAPDALLWVTNRSI